MLVNFTNTFNKNILLPIATFVIIFIQISMGNVYAQQKPSKDSLLILGNDYAEMLQLDGQSVYKLIHNVKVRHGSDTLFCDSAIFYISKNSIEAFGNAEILQADGTSTYADYMRYTGNNKTAYLRGNASVSNGNDNLWASEIEYNLTTKIGKYRNGGTLQSSTTTVSSDVGQYNTHTKDARFKKDVVIDDTSYHITSEDLGYNTLTKLVTFFAPSEVINDKSVLHTSSGTYDAKNEIAHFYKRSNITNESQYIESDTLYYDRNTGWAKAYGNVIAIDTTATQKRTLYAKYGQYNEKTQEFIATQSPIAKLSSNSDSLFIRADSFYSAPENLLRVNDTLSAQDSLQQTLKELHQAAAQGLFTDSSKLNLSDSNDKAISNDTLDVSKNDTISTVNIPSQDTIIQADDQNIKDTSSTDSLHRPKAIQYAPIHPTQVDTSKHRIMLAYHHVMIYSDSAQGRCDSLSYTQSDSLMRLYYHPILWSGNRQIMGDTIIAIIDSSHIRRVYVPKNGILISQSGPSKAGLYDQVQGNKMWAYFTNNKIDSVVAMPNASTIYFATDETDAYLGVSEVSAEKLLVLFDTSQSNSSNNESKIRQIKYYKSIDAKMTPMKDVNPSDFRLSRFKWLVNLRPKSLSDFMSEDYFTKNNEPNTGNETKHKPSKSSLSSHRDK